MLVPVPETTDGALPRPSDHRPGDSVCCWVCTQRVNPRATFFDPRKTADEEGYYCRPCALNINILVAQGLQAAGVV